MGKEDDPFAGLRSGNDLNLGGSLCAMVAARYPALRRSFISFSVTEEVSHFPLESDLAMVGGGGGGGEEDRNFLGAKSLRDWKAEETGRHGEERRNPLPSYRR